MTRRECLTRFGYIKPHGYDTDTVEKWLISADNRLRKLICNVYGTVFSDKTELILPDEHADIYIYYLQAQVDYFNGETARYNNSMNMFNTALAAFMDEYNRTHMPLQREVKV